MAWVAVIGAVSAQDVMDTFGLGRTVAYRWLRALVDRGLMATALDRAGEGALSAGGEVSRCRAQRASFARLVPVSGQGLDRDGGGALRVRSLLGR